MTAYFQEGKIMLRGSIANVCDNCDFAISELCSLGQVRSGQVVKTANIVVDFSPLFLFFFFYLIIVRCNHQCC